AAGYELHKVEEIYERTRNEIEAASLDQRAALQSQLLPTAINEPPRRSICLTRIAASKSDH
ncbi:MAG TPA: hypothetical protein VMS19_04950, partial [Methyloceanibacter sp.]|nr:hypothetical protein [Methyloceanibacter sp.]